MEVEWKLRLVSFNQAIGKEIVTCEFFNGYLVHVEEQGYQKSDKCREGFKKVLFFHLFFPPLVRVSCFADLIESIERVGEIRRRDT